MKIKIKFQGTVKPKLIDNSSLLHNEMIFIKDLNIVIF